MAAPELAKAETEVIRWVIRVGQQRKRLCRCPFYPIDRELAEQILATFETALTAAYRRRDRLLEAQAAGASQQIHP